MDNCYSIEHRLTSDQPLVWSATPTPFTDQLTLDVPAVERLVDHHERLGCHGLFLGGTCGEGPWMPDALRREFMRKVVEFNQGRMLLAAQVSDNSATRVLVNMEYAASDGADLAIIAPPQFMLNAGPKRIFDLYREASEKSPLPVGIYDRGRNGAVHVPAEILEAIYDLPNVVIVKDSSSDAGRRDIALKARARKKNLKLLNGDEFGVVSYAEAGYDGVMLGGAVLTGHLVARVLKSLADGDREAARLWDERVIDILYKVYGGKEISCWLSGLKRALVELGVFSTWRNFLEYPLHDTCVQDIERVVAEHRNWLLPEKEAALTA